MEQITLGQIAVAIGFIVALISGCKYILSDMKKILDKAFEPTNKKIDTLETNLKKEISKSDLNATKNYLVACLNDIEHGQKLEGVAKERFFEQLQHYQTLGGNGYIENEVDRLKKEGKV